jgi:hypothetical protein
MTSNVAVINTAKRLPADMEHILKRGRQHYLREQATALTIPNRSSPTGSLTKW